MPYSLRIIFAGTPDFAAYHLNILIHSSHKVIGVFTKPDYPAGRNNQVKISAVKKLAQEHNLLLFQPESLENFETWKNILKLNADIMVVVAYGLILPLSILKLPRLGCINVHGSLLPRWRGAAPIQRALLAGDKKTGITIIKMDSGLDTGNILHKTICDILPDDTSASLCKKLAQIGSQALLTTLIQIISGNNLEVPQNKKLATYAKKLNKQEAKINWNLSAVQLERCIRAFNPWPVSYFKINKQLLIKVWGASINHNIIQNKLLPGTIIAINQNGISVTTGDGILLLTLLQPESKKIMKVKELINSRQEWFILGNILD